MDTTSLPPAAAADAASRRAHLLYEQLVSLWTPAVIEAAHDVGLFSALSRGPATSDELAAALSVHPRGARILLDALFACDLVECDEQPGCAPIYTLPEDVKACVEPLGLFSLAGKMLYDRRFAWDAWRNFATAVREGGVDQSSKQCRQNQISPEEYRFLTRGINFFAPPIIHALGEGLAKIGWSTRRAISVLDVGCGTGIYSQLLLQRHATWRAVGMDCETMAALARAQSAELGVEDRFSCRASDLWRLPWGGDFDLILLCNMFHLQSPDGAARLMKLAGEAVSTAGIVCVIDQIRDEHRHVDTAQNRFALMFAASMLATGGGDTYTLEQYDEWLRDAGLERLIVLPAPMHRILIARRRSLYPLR
ncbi:class I SAM-dependent methyltransferase [Sorangium cellulosum]|uniref:class I SAM-dependent methyltransferase n=1 Tax=Sorangium cellulosum TaxID=56 RepID=UPI0018F88670|nr:class I SAM-dependent methyltransferase [Sorangium cellulosum]